MKTTRRGLFALLAGIAGSAMLGKVAPAETQAMPNGGWGIVQTPLKGETSLYYSSAKAYSVSHSTWNSLSTVRIHPNVVRYDLTINDLKRGNPRDQLWTKI